MTVSNRGVLRTETNFTYNVEKKVVVKGAATPNTMLSNSNSKHMSNEILTLSPRKSKAGRDYIHCDYDIERLIAFPVNKQVGQLASALNEASELVGHRFAGDTFVSQLDWHLRGLVRKNESMLAYSVHSALQRGDAKIASSLRDVVNRMADKFELLQSQTEAMCNFASVESSGDYSFHPFHTKYVGDHIIDNEEHESADFTDEEDAAAEFIRQMEQEDLKNRKESVSQLMNVEGDVTVIDPRISREEWVEEMMNRTPDEWQDVAKFAAWSVARMIMEQWILDYPIAFEYMNAKPKPLAFYSKARRKVHDVQAAIESRYRRIKYLNDLSDATDRDDSQQTIAAMKNSQNDAEVMEIEAQVKELLIISADIADVVEQMRPAMEIVELDGKPLEFSLYETYLFFDPIEFIVSQYQTVIEKVEKKRFTYDMKKSAYKAAMEQLQQPTIESFTFTQLNKHGVEVEVECYKLAWDKVKEPSEQIKKQEADPHGHVLLELIRSINLLRYQHSERVDYADKKRERESVRRAYAMQNKRIEVITDGRDDFLF